MNTRCFAYIENGSCFALNEMYCEQQHCKFYKDKEKAKKEFMKNYDKCKEGINYNIKKHFKNL